MATERPARVAIIGGGCAAMAAAFELTKPELGGRYQVTVYQQGWRLGGKGASGRGPCGRVEEHGLHIWMGFYENAFRLMRRVYEELGRDPTTCSIATWRDAFFPSPRVGLAHRDTDWAFWSAMFPALPGNPGEPLDANTGNPFTVLGYMQRAATVMLALFRVAFGPTTPLSYQVSSEFVTIDQLLDHARHLARSVVGATAVAAALIEQRLAAFVALIDKAAPRQVLAIGEALLAGIGQALARTTGEIDDSHRRRAAEVLEVLVAAQIGALRDGLLLSPLGFDKLDSYDFADWLRHNGASERAVNSSFVRGLYSLMFAYEDGDASRPRAAAGQALRGCLRMFFTYRGALFWKMRSGMGDVVFAPLYEVLRRRGVQFAFFHRLSSLQLSGDHTPPHVAALHFDIQATVASETYEPLIDVHGVPCWPSDPDWTQLEHGDALRGSGCDFESFWDRRLAATKELRVGHDFDFVVLAVGLGAIPHVAGELIERDRRWRTMTENLKTVATQALQLWMRPPLEALGWTAGTITLSAFASPFDTWSDMSHLVSEEAWPERNQPGSVAYFCNVLDERAIDPRHPAAAETHVRANVARFIETELPKLWPNLRSTDGAVHWDKFLDWRESAAADSSRLDAQFWSCNVNPSDRYVLCLPGTPRLRISPLDRTCDNLTVAGDWTSCGLNLGCVEAAVMSGMLAAHAITGSPTLEAIIGYDHP